MKKKIYMLLTIIGLVVLIFACAAPHQPYKVHARPPEPLQKPSGCVMEAGTCKPPNT